MAGQIPVQQLAPMPQQIGIFDSFIARQTETFILKEKVMSLSGDSFDIKMANGQPILKVAGNVLSLRGRKQILDMNNNALFQILKDPFHIHSTYVAKDPNGQTFLEVKSKFKLLGSNATATFTTPRTGKAESLSMKGNWLDMYADIVDTSNGMTVARIDRKFLTGREILFGQQTYAVTVAPGVDMALIVALCICLDEKNNEGGGGLIF